MPRPTPMFHSARPFPRQFSWTCLLCAFCLFLSGIAASARTQSGLEANVLHQQETALKATIDYLEDSIQKVKSGKYILCPLGLVEKDVLAGYIAAKMLSDDKTATEWAESIKNLTKYQRTSLKVLQEALDNAKAALEELQKKLAGPRKRPGQDKPRPRWHDGVTLELDSSTIDRRSTQSPTQWDVDKESGEGTYTPPYGKAKFEFKMPSSIGPEGENVHFGVSVRAKKGTRFAPAMSMVGEADLTGGNPQVYPVAESDMTAEEFKEVTIKPRQYSEDTKFVNIQVRFQDGPTITYKYRVVR